MTRTFFEFTCQPVHAGELTNLGRELLGCLPFDEENPFVEEDFGGVFMRFDGLVITNSGRDPGVDVGFLWRGTLMCRLNTQGVRLEGDDALVLRGIEGRQRVTLS